MDQDISQKETYFVAVKLFLEQDGRFLILKDNFGDWDLPGGRFKKDEFHTPFAQILQRKISEELGPDVSCHVAETPTIFMRHERIEAVPGSPTVRIFALGYQGSVTSGDIRLSPRHTEAVWVDPASFVPEHYFKGGWLEGIKDYLRLKKSI